MTWLVLGGLLLFAGAVAAALLRPWARLRAPSGPYSVGTTTWSLQDAGRARALHIRAWYPTREVVGRREGLWVDLQASSETPLPLRWIGRLLARKRTHSFVGAPLAVESAKLIVYNHGLISFASDNSLLMEHLASHGFVALGVQHLDQLTEYRQVMSAKSGKSTSSLMQRLGTALPREERARLSLELYERSVATREIVHRRAADTRFVLDRAQELLGQIPGAHDSGVEIEAIGLLGLSLGGAVATRAGLDDSRVRAVANLDGGLYGVDRDEHSAVPYLMLYSELNEGSNDHFLTGDLAQTETVTEATLAGARHMDLHDVKVVLPSLRLLGALGGIQPGRVCQLKNAAVTRHFETWLDHPALQNGRADSAAS